MEEYEDEFENNLKRLAAVYVALLVAIIFLLNCYVLQILSLLITSYGIYAVVKPESKVPSPGVNYATLVIGIIATLTSLITGIAFYMEKYIVTYLVAIVNLSSVVLEFAMEVLIIMLQHEIVSGSLVSAGGALSIVVTETKNPANRLLSPCGSQEISYYRGHYGKKEKILILDGRLQVEDRLLAINNHSLSCLSSADALALLKTSISQITADREPFIRLLVARRLRGVDSVGTPSVDPPQTSIAEDPQNTIRGLNAPPNLRRGDKTNSGSLDSLLVDAANRLNSFVVSANVHQTAQDDTPQPSTSTSDPRKQSSAFTRNQNKKRKASCRRVIEMSDFKCRIGMDARAMHEGVVGPSTDQKTEASVSGQRIASFCARMMI
ncbi:unnamed protein product [Hymenolepis diminuta]|uniref:PDZ domain-containing protein n=1 Tax=Hymenolepis diminuta TaxID=6216 RepID=A0A564YDA7_HYMDI|nr:unnamed protein product [Hymenolepis diminuta]